MTEGAFPDFPPHRRPRPADSHAPDLEPRLWVLTAVRQADGSRPRGHVAQRAGTELPGRTTGSRMSEE